MHVDIRKASIEDKQEVLELCKYFYNRWLPHAYYYFKNKWDKIHEQIMVATLENKIVGYFAFHTPNSNKRLQNTFYISDLYVLPSYRRKGIGTRLIESAERIKEEEGLSRIVVNIDKSSNSIRFYYRLGFRIYKRLPKSLKLVKTKD